MSALNLRWYAILKVTKIKLEISRFQTHMCIFFERGTRDQIFSISNRYSKAIQKYLKSYYPKQEPKHTIYLDANNMLLLR